MKHIYLIITLFSLVGFSQPNDALLLQEIEDGFTDPLSTIKVNDNIFLTVERSGQLFVTENGQRRDVPIVDIIPAPTTSGEMGFLNGDHISINGVDFFWGYWTVDANPRFGTIGYWILDIPNNTSTYQAPIFDEFFATSIIHQGGFFDAYYDADQDDYFVYCGFGDANNRWNAQRDSRNNGKVIRINAFTGQGHPGNLLFNSNSPFAPESIQYAKGLRNNYRGFVWNGILWLGDVGQSNAEELSRIDAPGYNLGWPLMEADLLFWDAPIPDNPDTGLPYSFDNELDAFLVYTHDFDGFRTETQDFDIDFNGVSIVPHGIVNGWGYSGNSITLTDFFRNELILVDLNGSNNQVVNVRSFGDSSDFNFVSHGFVDNNELYLTNISGKIVKVSYDETLSTNQYNIDPNLLREIHFNISSLPIVEEVRPVSKVPYLVKQEYTTSEQWKKVIYTNR